MENTPPTEFKEPVVPAIVSPKQPKDTRPKSSRKRLAILGTICVIGLISLVGGFIMFTLNTKPKTPVVYQPVSERVVVTPTKQVQHDLNRKEFKKRLFTPTDTFFSTREYPQELSNVKDDQLVGLRCTERYQSSFTTSEFDYKNIDERVRPVIESLTKENIPSISTIMVCDTEAPSSFVIYEIWGGGGGMNNTAYVGIRGGNNTVVTVATISNDGPAYFGCGEPLALTVTHDLYLQCGGGDGGSGGKSIYKINLAKKTKELVIKCEESARADDSGADLTCN